MLAVDDTHFPNVGIYEMVSGEKLWQFAPRQDAFLDNLLWAEVQTPTSDVEAVAGVNSDGHQDIAATSGCALYLLDGATGEEIWGFDAEDNLWQVREIRAIGGDGDQLPDIGAMPPSLKLTNYVSPVASAMIWLAIFVIGLGLAMWAVERKEVH